uniref:Uncharacterized protein n=1 Tax=Parascaris equorum TaxID=6256 RepID=A0A914RUM7_PAREQ
MGLFVYFLIRGFFLVCFMTMRLMLLLHQHGDGRLPAILLPTKISLPITASWPISNHYALV